MVKPLDPPHEPRVRAEAAAWLARRQTRPEDPQTRAALQAWLDQDERHRAAFSNVTEVWEVLPGAVAETRRSPVKPRGRSLASLALAACLLLVFAGVGALLWTGRSHVYQTAVGQQQSLALDDGTRVTLNTDSRIEVVFKRRERRVRLDRGEVAFDVAHDAKRPFVVWQGETQVRALGTSFVVRRDPDRLQVTLVKGRVEVDRQADRERRRIAMLKPGDRLTMIGEGGAVIDRPAFETILAWRKGEVMFDDVMLLEAANEVNRYTTTRRIRIDPSAASLRISGVFRISDSADFVETASALLGLKVSNQGADIVLSAPGSENNSSS